MIELAIIAAGKGIRLKDEGIKVSKPMVSINGVPLIKRIIDIATKNGIKSINCIINENSYDLREFLTNGRFSLPINMVIKSTKSSLHSLYELSKSVSSPFLLTTADSVFLPDEFTSFLEFSMNKNNADGIIAVTDFIDDEKPLYVSVSEEMKILNFHDKNERYKYVTGGLYLFQKNITNEVEKAVDSGVVRLRNFQRFLVQKDFELYAYPFSKIIDVDHKLDIVKAEEFLKNNPQEM